MRVCHEKKQKYTATRHQTEPGVVGTRIAGISGNLCAMKVTRRTRNFCRPRMTRGPSFCPRSCGCPSPRLKGLWRAIKPHSQNGIELHVGNPSHFEWLLLTKPVLKLHGTISGYLIDILSFTLCTRCPLTSRLMLLNGMGALLRLEASSRAVGPAPENSTGG